VEAAGPGPCPPDALAQTFVIFSSSLSVAGVALSFCLRKPTQGKHPGACYSGDILRVVSWLELGLNLGPAAHRPLAYYWPCTAATRFLLTIEIESLALRSVGVGPRFFFPSSSVVHFCWPLVVAIRRSKGRGGLLLISGVWW